MTGNHWVALPCIHPADASIHAIGMLHRGARSAIEFAGAPDFTEGAGPALVRPRLNIGGIRHELSDVPIAWERALGWIPTFTCMVGELVVRGTIFAPYGRDADVSGAVYALSIENRGASEAAVDVTLEGMLGHRQLRTRTPRAFEDASRVSVGTSGAVLLEGASLPGIVAVALVADGDGNASVDGNAFSLERSVRVAPGGREPVAFYLAVGPERDGAEATASVLRRRGWRELLSSTRDALQSLEQSSGNDALDRLINRNLLFAYFYSVGRALDDAQYYLIRTRAPWNGHGVTVRDWEALTWTIPAVQLADPSLARELLLRMCELHGYAPGRGVHYLDGTLFEPGFALEGVASYPIAADRYIRDTGDDRVVDEPALADTLYLTAEDLDSRRDKRIPLYSTEVSPSGSPAAFPFTVHANAAVAQALEVLRRTLDEETARGLQDPDAVRAAINRHFVIESTGHPTFASAVDLAGSTSIADDPSASLFWLPMFDAVARQDSTYRRTVKRIDVTPHSFVQQCARLVGPDATAILQWLRRAPLDGGIAAEVVDVDGRVVGNGGDAALSGLLAWTAWYAANAFGERG
jgi:Metal-independent alpha-mannosidase (GH125)